MYMQIQNWICAFHIFKILYCLKTFMYSNACTLRQSLQAMSAGAVWMEGLIWEFELLIEFKLTSKRKGHGNQASPGLADSLHFEWLKKKWQTLLIIS